MRTEPTRIDADDVDVHDVNVDDVDVDDIDRYLERVGLPPLALDARGPASDFAARLGAALTQPVAVPPDDEALLGLFRYPVPKLGPGGSCSIAHELEPEPFDLRTVLGLSGLSVAAVREHPQSARLARLRQLCTLLHEETRSDWTGIYRAVTSLGTGTSGGAALCKEAYLGRPSRALFPLTPEFAAISNNSTAALERRAILVADVEAHLAAGLPYYECDAAVRAELCMPVLADGGAGPLLGLVDLESFAARHYGGPPAETGSSVATGAVAALALVLGRERLLEPRA